jgi:integrase
VSCKQLGTAQTKAASWQAANDWWLKKLAEIEAKTEPTLSYETEVLQKVNAWATANGQVEPFPIYEDEKENKLTWQAISSEARAIWLDRTKGMKKPSGHGNLEKLVDKFVNSKKVLAESGEISLGRWDNVRRYLAQWKEWIGEEYPSVLANPSSLDGIHLQDYKEYLLGRIKGKVKNHKVKPISDETADGNLIAVKEFYGWLDMLHVIELPKATFMRKIHIKVAPKKVKTIPLTYIQKLMAGATDREKLYICLMLNCGFYQGDIAQLTQEQVNLKQGYIRRKRSKTEGWENVPEVKYPLWKTTNRLLEQFHNTKGELFLLNDDGKPLKNERIKEEDGKYTKNDNIAVAYYRMCKRLGITNEDKQPLKRLRKTSNTILKNSIYSMYAVLFLGQASKTIQEINYDGNIEEIGPSDLNFTKAIQWLGTRYGIE